MRWLFNFGVNITAVIIFLVLFLTAMFGTGKRNKIVSLFATTLLLVLLSEIAASLYYLFLYLEIDIEPLLYLTSILRYIFTFAASLLLILYVIFYFNLKLFSKKLAVILACSIGTIYLFLVLLNINIPIFYYFDLSRGNVMIRTNTYPFIHIPNLIIYLLCLAIVFTRKKISFAERLSFTTLPVILFATLVFDITYKEYSIYAMGLLASFLFHYLFYFIRRGMQINQLQNELSNQQVNIMLSQIQPHFIYNCLSAISYLCVQDGKKAQTAIEDFSNYLRGNFSNISNIRMIPFSKELEHTKAYLRLEKMRFDDRVNIVYDIKYTDFLIPSLTLQPIVENTVKHGICKRAEGGTVEISTWVEGDRIFIRVKDNGVGFDMNAPISDDDRAHVGLNNVTSRLEHLSFGKITIESKINVGTTVTIELPKENNKDVGGGHKK